MHVAVKKLLADAVLPERAHFDDSGADLFAIECVEIPPRSPANIKTGISIALPHGTSGFVWGKSSLESSGLITTAGLIDAGYRGEIIVCMFNLTNRTKILGKGQKIAQLVVVPTYYPEFREIQELPLSKRGAGGFGSTGKHKNDL
ncbi:MAG: dUTP diphosphatase [Elusimicrobia bacterium]|nr:dUTP diphosphatase [Elusimicrobiota bacterium]